MVWVERREERGDIPGLECHLSHLTLTLTYHPHSPHTLTNHNHLELNLNFKDYPGGGVGGDVGGGAVSGGQFNVISVNDFLTELPLVMRLQ